MIGRVIRLLSPLPSTGWPDSCPSGRRVPAGPKGHAGLGVVTDYYGRFAANSKQNWKSLRGI